MRVVNARRQNYEA